VTIMAKTTEQTVWCIHGGRVGEADSLFLKHNVVALDYRGAGDLSVLAPNRDAFKDRILQVSPEIKPGALNNSAGQIFRFIHEMQVGDLVVYPSKIDRRMHIGRVEGPYVYVVEAEGAFPHRRAVRWLKAPPRTSFSQGALYETGSALSFFQIRNYADEFRAAPEGRPPALPVEKDETVAVVAENIEQTTHDFVLKQLAQELKGHPLAEFVAHLLGAMGYRTRVSPEGPDGGVDILAHKDELGFEPPIIKVQVKSSEGNIGEPIVAALNGIVAAGEFGLLVTLGSFTNQAKSFARSKSNLRLIDGEALVDLILAHYDQFDSRYKGLLPLKRVYVPEPLEEAET